MLFEQVQQNTKKYISIVEFVEELAFIEGTLLKAVFSLLHFRIDESVVCFKKNEYLEFINLNHEDETEGEEAIGAYDVLLDIKKEAEDQLSSDKKVSNELKEKYKDFFWQKQALSKLKYLKDFNYLLIDSKAENELQEKQSTKDKQQIAKLKAENMRLKEHVNRLESAQEKPLHTRTANNAAKIIGALAEMNKLNLTEPYGQANKSIQETLERLGSRVDKEPIAEWLKQAGEQLK